MTKLLLLGTPSHGGWLQRALLAVAAAGIVLVGFFFLTVALVAGAILAGVIAVRWWWFVRKLKQRVRAQQGPAPLEGDYSVVQPQRVEYRTTTRD